MVKELQVAALKSGTVIDHIPPVQLFKVVAILRLQDLENRITIGNNLGSSKMGTKGIIKISDKFFESDEINRVALVAPKVVLNIIKNYEVVEKRRVTLPNVITGIGKCNNPKCITNNEPMKTRFDVKDKDQVILQCHYCEIKVNKEDIILSKGK